MDDFSKVEKRNHKRKHAMEIVCWKRRVSIAPA